MPTFYYIEAYYPSEDPDLLYFRHTAVAARNEADAYALGLRAALGRPQDRMLNNYVIPCIPSERAAPPQQTGSLSLPD